MPLFTKDGSKIVDSNLSVDDKLNILLDEIEFSVRTRNCFKDNNIIYIYDLVKMNSNEMLRWPNFGRKSLKEVDDVLLNLGLNFGMSDNEIRIARNNQKSLKTEHKNREKSELKPLDIPDSQYRYFIESISTDKDGWFEFLKEEYPEIFENLYKLKIYNERDFLIYRKINEYSKSLENFDNFRYRFYIENNLYNNSHQSIMKAMPLWALEMDIKYFYPTSTRLKNFVQDQNFQKVLDFAKYTDGLILRVPGMGRGALKSISDSLLGIVPKGKPPVDGTEIKTPLIECFHLSLDKIKDERAKIILDKRLGINQDIKTLEELGNELGVTRERIRQLQSKTIQMLLDSEFWDDVIMIKLNNLMKDRSTPLLLEDIAKEDDWFSGFDENLKFLENLILFFGKIPEIRFISINGSRVLSKIDQETWNSLKYELLSDFENSLEYRYNIDDVEFLIQSKLQEISVSELSSLMIEEVFANLNFVEEDGNLVLASVGNSLKSFLRAILDQSEEPLHFEEVYKRYNEEYENKLPSERYVHSCLVGNKTFLLFDRGTYGLEKHLQVSSEDKEKTIEQVEEFFEKNPTKQWHTSSIIKKCKLTDIYGIDKYTLTSVLFNSQKLSYLGKSVWKLAGNENTGENRILVKDVICKSLLESDKPLTVNEIYEKVTEVRGVSEYFQVFPTEIYAKLNNTHWGLVDRDFVHSRTEWNEILDLFFVKITKINKALLVHEIMEIYNDFDCKNEDVTQYMVFGILQTDPRFRTWPGGFIGLSTWEDKRRISFERAFKDALDENLQEISLNDLEAKIKEIIDYDFQKTKISVYLNKAGYSFLKERNIWIKAN